VCPKEISERKVALLLRIREGLKDQLGKLAKREHRSLNQQIEFILEHFLSDVGNQEVHEKQNPRTGHA
jgi:hypothetical protein